MAGGMGILVIGCGGFQCQVQGLKSGCGGGAFWRGFGLVFGLRLGREAAGADASVGTVVDANFDASNRGAGL